MTLTQRKKQWIGAIVSILSQTSIFVVLDIFFGHFISALFVLVVNLAIAANYKITNPYFVGARWATFWNLGLASYSRHGYWYENVLASFVRLRDFDNPVPAFEKLCQGKGEDMLMIAGTSLLIIAFYFFVTKWPEWTGRWEMLRRAPFSASLGLQSLILVTVVYPTAFTMITALMFAGVISPILRRQIRFNHIIFLMLVPLFALGSYNLSFACALLGGIAFFYCASIERAMSPKIASYTFFLGVAFTALFVSMAEARAIESLGRTEGGFFALASFVLTLSASYILLWKRQQAVKAIRELLVGLTPAKVKNSSWWKIREGWVDREIDCRVNKRYSLKTQKIDLGLFFFGPKEWAPGSENYEKVTHGKLNLTPSILVLAFYSIWLLIDAVLALTNQTLAVTIAGLSLGFLTIIALPVALFIHQYKNRDFYKRVSLLTTGFSFIIFGFLMSTVLVLGLSSNSSVLNNVSAANEQAQTTATTEGSPYKCPCDEEDSSEDSVRLPSIK